MEGCLLVAHSCQPSRPSFIIIPRRGWGHLSPSQPGAIIIPLLTTLSPEVFILIITCSSAASLPFLSWHAVRTTARWHHSCFHHPSQVYVSSQAVEAACWFSASFCSSFSPKVRAPTRPKAWRHWLPLPSAKPSRLTVSAGLVRLE